MCAHHNVHTTYMHTYMHILCSHTCPNSAYMCAHSSHFTHMNEHTTHIHAHSTYYTQCMHSKHTHTWHKHFTHMHSHSPFRTMHKHMHSCQWCLKIQHFLSGGLPADRCRRLITARLFPQGAPPDPPSGLIAHQNRGEARQVCGTNDGHSTEQVPLCQDKGT